MELLFHQWNKLQNPAHNLTRLLNRLKYPIGGAVNFTIEVPVAPSWHLDRKCGLRSDEPTEGTIDGILPREYLKLRIGANMPTGANAYHITIGEPEKRPMHDASEGFKDYILKALAITAFNLSLSVNPSNRWARSCTASASQISALLNKSTWCL